MQLQSGLAALRAHGAVVVAASLDPVHTSVGLIKAMHLGFPIVHDAGHQLGAAFGDYQLAGTHEQDNDALVVLDANGHVTWRKLTGGVLVAVKDVLAAVDRA